MLPQVPKQTTTQATAFNSVDLWNHNHGPGEFWHFSSRAAFRCLSAPGTCGERPMIDLIRYRQEARMKYVGSGNIRRYPPSIDMRDVWTVHDLLRWAVLVLAL